MKPTKKVRGAIDSLSKNELRDEINQGRVSRFSRARPYMEERFARLEDETNAEERGEDISLIKRGHKLAAGAIIVSLLGIIVAYIFSGD